MSTEIARFVGFVVTWITIAMVAIEVLNVQGSWLMLAGHVAAIASMAVGNWTARAIA